MTYQQLRKMAYGCLALARSYSAPRPRARPPAQSLWAGSSRRTRYKPSALGQTPQRALSQRALRLIEAMSKNEAPRRAAVLRTAARPSWQGSCSKAWHALDSSDGNHERPWIADNQPPTWEAERWWVMLTKGIDRSLDKR